jgi:ABC-type transporter Mla MlaB component
MRPAGHLPLLWQQNAAAVCEMDAVRLDLAEMRWLRRVVRI